METPVAISPAAFSVEQAAVYIGVRPVTIRVYVREGWVKATRLGRRVVIRKSELDRILAEGLPSRPRGGDHHEGLQAEA